MIKVVFIGDSPSKTNLSENLAFVGAKCFPRLVEWIKVLSPDYYVCINSDTDENLQLIKNLVVSEAFKAVCLGNSAAKRISQIGIEHFMLPHPSGLNRQINDTKYIQQELEKAFEFIRSYE